MNQLSRYKGWINGEEVETPAAMFNETQAEDNLCLAYNLKHELAPGTRHKITGLSPIPKLEEKS